MSSIPPYPCQLHFARAFSLDLFVLYVHTLPVMDFTHTIAVIEQANKALKQRVEALEKDYGRPLTSQELTLLLNCPRCFRPNGDCDCIDW